MKSEMKHTVHPINRALAFVEGHLTDNLRVEDIARHSGISRHHFSRVFTNATGYSLARYVRLRRLTEAARQLLQSDDTVLNIALSVGYESHSVFSRAFNSEFGVSPSELRNAGCPDPIAFVHPILWSSDMKITIPTPRSEEGLSLKLVGVRQQFVGDDDAKTMHSKMRSKLLSAIPSIPHQPGPSFYHYIWDVEDDPINEAGHALAYKFFMGVEVTRANDLPEGLSDIEIDWNSYVAFPFSINVTKLNDFIMAIYGEWFPQSKWEPVDSSHLQSFKPNTDWTPEKESALAAGDFSDLNIEGEIFVPVA